MPELETDLRSFLRPGVLGLASALTLAAVLGKQACAAGAVVVMVIVTTMMTPPALKWAMGR